MDVSQLEVPNTAIIHIEFPGVGKLYSDKEKTKPTTIEVFGPASDEAVAQRRKISRDARQMVAKNGAKAIAKRSQEEIEDAEIDHLVAMTSCVKNLEYNGKAISRENINIVYRDPKMGWLVDQVKEKISGWENFLD